MKALKRQKYSIQPWTSKKANVADGLLSYGLLSYVWRGRSKMFSEMKSWTKTYYV